MAAERLETQSAATPTEGALDLTVNDIDQIIEGIERFIIEDIEDVREVWQPYLDKLSRLRAAHGGRTEEPQDVVAVAGRCDRTIADFIRACSCHLVEQQESLSPNNALIAVLCDAIRLARENIELATVRSSAGAKTPTRDAR